MLIWLPDHVITPYQCSQTTSPFKRQLIGTWLSYKRFFFRTGDYSEEGFVIEEVDLQSYEAFSQEIEDEKSASQKSGMSHVY